MEGVTDDRRPGFSTVQVDLEAGGPGGAVVSDGEALPGSDREFADHLDRSRAVRPEVDHAPAELAVRDQQFDARGVTVARVEAGAMQHRGAGVLLAEADEGRERQRVEAPQLLEFRKLETGVAVELHGLTYYAWRELQVFG